MNIRVQAGILFLHPGRTSRGPFPRPVARGRAIGHHPRRPAVSSVLGGQRPLHALPILMSSPLLASVAVLALLTAAWGAGTGLIPPQGRPTTGPPPGRTLAIGFCLLAWLGVLLGSGGLLAGGRQLGIVLLACAGSAALGILRLRRPRALYPTGTTSLPPPERAAVGPRLVVGVAMLMTFGPALMLPTGWDELVYHSELPRRWQADGSLRVYSDLPYSAFPSLGEVLFWLAAPLDVLFVPRMLNWVAWSLAISLLYRWTRRQLGPWAAAILTLSTALSAAVLMVSANCYVEAFQLLLLVASLDVATENRDQPAWRDVVTLGIAVGGAASVKLTGLVLLGVPAVLSGTGRGRGRWTGRQAALATGIALLVAAPFYLRAWQATGNPFFPYLDAWFSADPDRVAMSGFHHSIGAGFGLHSVQGLFTGPVLLAFNDALYDGCFGWQLPVLLGLATAACLRWRGGTVASSSGFLAILTAGLYLFWFFTAQQARFATPLVFVLAWLGALGLARIRPRIQTGISAVLLTCTIAGLPWKNAGYYFGSWETQFGWWSQREMLDDGTGGLYLPLMDVLAKTPPASRVLLLFEHRGFYVPRSREIGTPIFRAGGLPRDCEQNAAALLDWLRSRNCTHVVLARAPLGPDQTPEWRAAVEYVYRAVERGVAHGVLVVDWESETHVVMSVHAPDQSP